MQIGKRIHAFMITLLSGQSLQTTSCVCLFWSAWLPEVNVVMVMNWPCDSILFCVIQQAVVWKNWFPKLHTIGSIKSPIHLGPFFFSYLPIIVELRKFNGHKFVLLAMKLFFFFFRSIVYIFSCVVLFRFFPFNIYDTVIMSISLRNCTPFYKM